MKEISDVVLAKLSDSAVRSSPSRFVTTTKGEPLTYGLLLGRVFTIKKGADGLIETVSDGNREITLVLCEVSAMSQLHQVYMNIQSLSPSNPAEKEKFDAFKKGVFGK